MADGMDDSSLIASRRGSERTHDAFLVRGERE